MCVRVCVHVSLYHHAVSQYVCESLFLMLIGNYGNKLDTNTPAQSSTTPPTNPVFDGTKYYFLPWMDQPQKPCCVVDSWWEDCTYRIESANIIHFTADRLVREEENSC